MGYYRGDCSRGDYYRGDYYRGDPFSLGGILKSVTGVVAKAGIPGISTIAGGINALAGGSATTKQPTYITPILPQPSSFPGQGGTFVGLKAGSVSVGYERHMSQGGSAGISLTPGGALVPCQLKGYHPNKSAYYRRSGQDSGVRIEKNSVCVKSRHMNVANGRALKRALRRAYGFKKMAMRSINLLSPPGKKKRFGGFKRKGR